MSVRGNTYRVLSLSTRIIASVISAGVILCLAPCLMFGQANLARLSGNVRDQLGGAIVGGSVSVIDADRGPERDVVTDEAGAYVLNGFVPGGKANARRRWGFT